MASKQNIQAIDAWNRENTELIRIRPRKEEHLCARIDVAIQRGITKSRQAYIVNAIKKALEEDGIPLMEDSEAKDEQ